MVCPQEYNLSSVYLTKFPFKFIYGWWWSTKNERESMLTVQDWLASRKRICTLSTKLTCLITAKTPNSHLLYTLGEGEKSLGTKTAFSGSAGKVSISRTCQSRSVRAVNFQSQRETGEIIWEWRQTVCYSQQRFLSWTVIVLSEEVLECTVRQENKHQEQ